MNRELCTYECEYNVLPVPLVKRIDLRDRRPHRRPSGGSPCYGGLEGLPHLARLHERALLPGLDHHDGTGGVAADRRRRPPQEDIEEATLAMGANDQQVDPERLGGGDDQLARVPHLQQRRDRGLVSRDSGQEGLHLRRHLRIHPLHLGVSIAGQVHRREAQCLRREVERLGRVVVVVIDTQDRQPRAGPAGQGDGGFTGRHGMRAERLPLLQRDG
jgi:hypothetical protein